MSALESYPRITPFLWFESNAEEAVDFYVGVFKNSRRLDEMRDMRTGGLLIVGFELDGQKFTALNGGPGHKLTDAVSFVVRCDTQAEIDDYWAKLTAGGQEVQCGWLKDKYGLSWQIVPSRLASLLKHPKAMEALMKMVKLDIAELERAGRE